MLKKVMLFFCMFAFLITSVIALPAKAEAASTRRILQTDDLQDLSKIYKTSKKVEIFSASTTDAPKFGGDQKLLRRTETGTTYVYYKVNGLMKSVTIDMYFNTGLYAPVEFYVSTDDTTYVWAQKNESPLVDTANGWKKKTYALNTTYLNSLKARYIRIPIPQNNANVTNEPMLGNVSIEYETDPGYLNNDASLGQIKVGADTLQGFNSSVTSYQVRPVENTVIGEATQVYATAADAGYAQVSITQATSFPGNAKIHVTAEDGVTTKDYTIYFSGVPGAKNNYYVSKTGNDELGNGSIDNPWKTIQKAADMMVAGDTCIIREGKYYEKVVVNCSGTEANPIVFKAYPGESVTISGADPVTGWQPYSGSIYKANMNWNLNEKNQVFVNGELLNEARWPNIPEGNELLQPAWAIADSGTATTLQDSELTQPDGYWDGAKVMVKGGDGWILQSSKITGYKQSSGLTFDKLYYNEGTFYSPRAGNKYYLYGKLELIDSNKEWYYDNTSSTMYLGADSDPNSSLVEAKTRDYAFVLNNCSNIKLDGIHLFAAGIDTENANNIKLDRINMKYTYEPIILSGNNNEISNSTLSYAPTSLISVTGSDNRIVNNLISNSNYLGTWQAAVRMGGNHNLLSYNTIDNSGRTCIEIIGRANLIEYNDVYNGGMLTNDTGLLYGAYTDADNTVIRYNWVHDNKAEILPEGIYPDNSSFNYIIHHNVVWNVGAALRLNTPNNYMLVYNNTLIGNTGMYGFIYREDMYGGRFNNNIVTGGYNFSSDVVRSNNIEGSIDPMFVNPAEHDFRLQSGSPAIDNGINISGITESSQGNAPDIGAYEYGGIYWIPGHNFENPPAAVFEEPNTTYMNRVTKGGFESLRTVSEPWVKTEGQNARTLWEYSLNSNKKTRGGNWSVQLGNVPDRAYPIEAINALEQSIAAAKSVYENTNATPADICQALTDMNNTRADLAKQAPDIIGDPGFETGSLTGWYGESSKKEIVNTDMFSGNSSLRSFQRIAAWAGPRMNLSFINGRTYNVSSRVKLGAGTDSVILSMMPNGVNTPRRIAIGSASSTAWSQVKGRFTPNETTELTYGLFTYFTQSTLADLYLDNVYVVDVTELVTKIAEANKLLETLSGESKTIVSQAVTNAQAVLDNYESSEEAVAEAVRLLGIAMAQQDIATKDILNSEIIKMQNVVNMSVSVEDGIQQTITGLKPDTRYRLSGWALVADARDSVIMGVRDFGGDEATASFNSTSWARKELTFTTGHQEQQATIYLKKPRGVGNVYADDICVSEYEEAAPAANNIGVVSNPDFETGDIRPWFSFDSDIAATDSYKYNGNYSLSVSNRKSNQSGAWQYINVSNNKVYDVSAWVRTGTGSDTVQLVVNTTLNATTPGGINQRIAADGQVNDSEWTHITGQISFDEPGAIYSAAVGINSLASSNDLYIDDFVVKEHLLPTEPGTGDGETDLNSAIDETDSWVFNKGSAAVEFGDGSIALKDGNARYTGKTYRDAMLSFNMRVDGNAASWPIINIRNKGSENFSSGYVFVIKQSEIELQKYNDGKSTMILFGSQNDHGVAGPSVVNSFFAYGQDNLVEVGAVNTENGVRIMLNINGSKVIDYEDTSDSIRNAGYFSLNYGTAQRITISKIKINPDIVLLEAGSTILKNDGQTGLKVTGTRTNGSFVDLSKAEVTFTSSDTTVADVSYDKTEAGYIYGKASAKQEGTAIIKATVTLDGKTVTSNEITITADGTPPQTNASGNAAEGWNTTAVAITLTAQDNLSGVEKTEYRLGESSEWLTYTQPIIISQDGTNILQYRSSDKAGNIEEAKQLTVKIDKISPATAATTSGAIRCDGSFNSYVTITLAADDAQGGSGVANTQYSLDGVNWLTYTEPVVLEENGSYNFSYRSVDNAGNVEAAKSLDIKISMDSYVMTSYLIAEIKEMNVDANLESSLMSKLQNVKETIIKDNKNSAKNKLSAFINEITAQRDKKLTGEQVDKMEAYANKIIDAINLGTTINVI